MLLPGRTVGVVGGGQLGRMLVLEARRMGYRTVVFTDEPSGSPAGQVAECEINASFDDQAARQRFTEAVDVVTVEFENIPAEFLQGLPVAIHPSPTVISTCQNREREKTFLRANGIPCAPFAVVDSEAALVESLETIGRPAVLKTANFGYDGKGQVKIDPGTDVSAAWHSLAGQCGVLEGWVPYRCELSVVAARGMDGEFVPFAVAENEHRNHILDVTIAPARISSDEAAAALALARKIADALMYVGVLAVEMFLQEDGTLLVNEIAPRPHNSGHHSLDSCLVSQFGQQLRAVTGQPLADPNQFSPAVMVNLLGDVWPSADAPPDWEKVLANPRARLHLYGKAKARTGRKMGHFTVLGEDLATALNEARAIQSTLVRR